MEKKLNKQSKTNACMLWHIFARTRKHMLLSVFSNRKISYLDFCRFLLYIYNTE